ncbi:MAG: excinuclease ABC subunit UvrC [Acidimicrobiaceae bacterium]|nr:excinuclease ABC subunit UvrC [Acidimicrobiaceae bacterium]
MFSKPPSSLIPDSPGSYQFLDADGRIIYVGKAKSLRSRLSTYFASRLSFRTRQMMNAAASVEWIQVANEVEALILEFSLIQRHKPRYNVRFTDDKSYPFMCVSTFDEWPRVFVTRGRHRKGNRYFGPYVHVRAIRETLDLLLQTFPIRTCTDNKFRRYARLGKPCLLYHIEKCSAPCVDAIDADAYADLTRSLLRFLEGNTAPIVDQLESQMKAAAGELNFELAARLRDRLESVRQAVETQQMVGSRREDFDVIGMVDDKLETAVQVFFVRNGRVLGRRGFVVDKAEQLETSKLMGRILERIYFESNPLGPPKQVLVPALPIDPELYEQWLSSQRGSKVAIRVPQRGAKKVLMRTVTDNASESFARHRLKRMTNHNSRARALNELQKYLQLQSAPLRIECYDASHLSGQDYVGSMVVVEDGLPCKSQYRRFKIRTVNQNDDFAAIEEVLTRRLTSYIKQRELPVGERDKRFSYPPQLLLVDGGKGQLSVAVKTVRSLGLEHDIAVAALAKRFEEVFVPQQAQAVRIPRQSEALYMLQRIRDESHRFAVEYHRQLRVKRMKRSLLDGISGLGPARRARLIKEMGSMKAVRNVELADLKALSWLPDKVAENVYEVVSRRP